MKNIVYAFTAASLTVSPVFATPPPPPEYTPEQLRDAALSDDLIAFNVIEGLTTEIGPRQGGTEAEARARNWARDHLNNLGFQNVRIETFKMPTWIRGEERAEITAPFKQKLLVTALGNSASTGAQGITAPIVYFPTLDALRAVPDGSLTGKIAFVSHAMKPTQDGSSYGAFGPARFVGPNVASQKGAVAIVIRSAGTDYHRNPHTGNTNFEKGVTPIPAGALSIPDAENLERMLKRNQPVTMNLVLTPKNIGMQQSGNVIAEIPGSNPALGMIVVACHLDSWDLGTGAIDDAAGCGIVTAAAVRAKWFGQPKRTIRVLWAGAEEVGVWGGKDYAVKHANENHALAMEADFGAGRAWAADFNLPGSAAPLAAKIAELIAPLGIARRTAIASGGADIGPIIAAQRLGVIDIQQDGTRYFDLHHTPDDTLDKIDPAELRQNVAAWTAVLTLLGQYEGELKPDPAAVAKP
jgi:carboxypeptidase Q